MKIAKTSRRVGVHTMSLKPPKLKTQIGSFGSMKPSIKMPKLKKLGFPKGHVY